MQTGTVMELLWTRATREPDQPLFSFVDDEGREVGALNQGETVASSEAIAAYLLGPCGLKAGDRVLLVYPPSLAFVTSLLACLRAGLVPVPVCPPLPATLAYDLTRLTAMAESSGARAVLTSREYQNLRRMLLLKGAVQSLLARKGAAWPELPWHTTDQVRPGARLPEVAAPVALDDLALLQYTSGSTAFPKGVRITHRNLVHQFTLNRAELGLGPTAHMVTWVPHFHDFGLISGILAAAFGNGRLTFMSPTSFIRRPAVWLEVASRVQATHMAAPTFAYDMAVRKTTPAQRAGWDLSRVHVAMAAAEPVRPATMRAFCEAFAPAGFRPEALCPAYGLAEHTVGVTTFGRGTLRVARAELEREGRITDPGESESTELMACGAPTGDVVVKIVDPDTACECAPERVGEIWVDSPSKADGYEGLPDESRATFQAELVGATDGRRYLRTGDLGFLRDGQLYITGRSKDLIIVRGRNLYPQDLEDSVTACHELVRPGSVAAFTVDAEQGEELVVFVELRSDKPAAGAAEMVAKAVRLAVLADHQVGCRTVVVGASGLVPKTTSGKVRRQDCRRAFLAGQHTQDPAHRHTATFELEPRGEELETVVQAVPAASEPSKPSFGLKLVCDAIAAELGVEVQPSTEFAELGLDSVQITSLFSRLSAETGLTPSPVALLDFPTLGDLAGWIDRSLAPAAQTAALPAVDPDSVAALTAGKIEYTHVASVPYYERNGAFLMVDIFAPRGPSNGLGVIDVVSAGWQTGTDTIKYHIGYTVFESICAQGFTVFAISPGSLPRYDLQEQLQHVQRAIRWVKSRAALYGIDPDRLALMGASSGGQLACLAMVHAAALPPDLGFHGGAFDTSVAAVVAVCPIVQLEELEDHLMTDLHRMLYDTDYTSGGATRVERLKAMSALQHVQGKCPPTLIFHAIGDPLAPFARTLAFAAALRKAGGSVEVAARNSNMHEYKEVPADFPRAAAWLSHVLTGQGSAPDLVSYVPPGALFTPLLPTPRQRLFCFHDAGGDAGAFKQWPDGLPGIEVQALQLPGRAGRVNDAALTSFEQILSAAEGAVEAANDKPFAFFGHGMGAVLAFELARRLRRAGRPLPTHLFLSAYGGPGPQGWLPPDEALAQIRTLLGLEALMDAMLLGQWACLAEPPLDVPILAFGGEGDPFGPSERLERWRGQTAAGFELQLFPGGHGYLDGAKRAVWAAVQTRLGQPVLA